MTPLLDEKEGVRICIYSREHLPPHVHLYYGDDDAVLEIRTGKLLKGYLPAKNVRFVQDWLRIEENRVAVEKFFFQLNPSLRDKIKT